MKKPPFHPVVVAWLALVLLAALFILLRNAVQMIQGLGMGTWLDRLTYVLMFAGLFFYVEGVWNILFQQRRKGVWKMLLSTFAAFLLLAALYAIAGEPLQGDGWKTFFQFYVGFPTLFALVSASILLIRKDGASAWSQLN